MKSLEVHSSKLRTKANFYEKGVHHEENAFLFIPHFPFSPSFNPAGEKTRSGTDSCGGTNARCG
ncbi:MAG: hypothetical protein IJQ31_04895 [Thermoguttaceae bacterium]|nr:hypothetical protein [Thermoguttaceae bacterium]